MHKPFDALAVTLRWLAVLWLVGWALYAAIWGESRPQLIDLGLLLLPAALAIGVAWTLDRVSTLGSGHRGTGHGS